MTDLRTAVQQALEALGKWSSGRDIDAVQLNDLIATLESALEQPEQATGKESLQVGQEEPEGGWQSAPSPQVTQRIADMPMSEYRRGVNDGFKLGLREGRIKAEDEMREQPEQPVAWLESPYGSIRMNTTMRFQFPPQSLKWKIPLYTHPPRREPEQEPVGDSYADLFNALQRIETAAVFLPSFKITHEGGLEAVVQNIVDAIAALEQPTECRWLQDGDEDSGTYMASCNRRYFVLEDGTPTDNHMTHCCYCGKPLVEVPIEPEDNHE
jgi:hypothetical protein